MILLPLLPLLLLKLSLALIFLNARPFSCLLFALTKIDVLSYPPFFLPDKSFQVGLLDLLIDLPLSLLLISLLLLFALFFLLFLEQSLLGLLEKLLGQGLRLTLKTVLSKGNVRLGGPHGGGVKRLMRFLHFFLLLKSLWGWGRSFGLFLACHGFWPRGFVLKLKVWNRFRDFLLHYRWFFEFKSFLRNFHFDWRFDRGLR